MPIYAPALIVEDEDGSPSVSGVTKIQVTNGELTHDGGGVVSLDLSGGGGGGGSIPTVINRLGSGDVSITATTNVFASNITGLGDITLACATGDLIVAGVSALCPNSTAQSLKLDVCTVVSAAAVNFFSNGTGTGATNGVTGWYMTASLSAAKAGGSVPYVAQSGDISGGNIVLRLLCHGTGTRTIGASTATSPLIFWAQNHGQ